MKKREKNNKLKSAFEKLRAVGGGSKMYPRTFISKPSLQSITESSKKIITNVADLTLLINNTININGLSVMLSSNKDTFKHVK